METHQHRLAAVWFADIVGYTRQATEDEERAMRVVHAFQEAARDVARRYGGRIVKFIGDAAMAEFSSTESAVRAACRLAPSCAERSAASGVECPTLRIAAHVGDVTTTADGDVYGDGVNVAARIVREVEPGEIWVSEDVWRQLRHRPRFRFEERGARELKGMDPVRAYAVIGEEGEEAEEARGLTSRARAVLGELRRRNVGRVAIVYAVVGWLVIQVVGATFPTLGLPAGIARAVMLLVILGFPVAVALAWAYELTPQGIRRTSSLPVDTRPKGGRGLLHQAVVAIALITAVAAWLAFGPENPVPGEASDDAAAALPMGDPARVAVLYFDDFSEGKRLEHLANGITEALIHDLSQIEAIEVIPRTGVKTYRDATVPVDSIARALGAGTLVEGSVAESGDRVRVTAQLIDATHADEMSHLASVEVERPLGELFALQDELVAEVSRQLRRRLGTEILERSRHATSSVPAWELFQRAEGLRTQAKLARDAAIQSSLRSQADSLLARSEALDQDWIEPTLLRAQLALDQGEAGSLRGGLAHAARAESLGPRDARVPGLRGALEYGLARQAQDSSSTARLLAESERDLRNAIVLDPSLASAWISLADLLYQAKWQLVQAREAAERAYREDAFLLEWEQFAWLCEISLQLKEYDQAEAWCDEGGRRNPGQVWLPAIEIAILASDNGSAPDVARAWRLVDDVDKLASSENRMFFGGVLRLQAAAVLVRAGLRDSAMDVVRRARTMTDDASPGDKAQLDYYEAYVRLLLGERAEAVRLLRSFLEIVPSYRARVANDHWFEGLNGDPRFEALVDRKRLPIYCEILCEPPP